MNSNIVDINGLTETEFLKVYNPDQFDRPSVSVDTVIFSIDSEEQKDNYRKLDEQKLTVLLVKRREHPDLGCWSLPGGFVGIREAVRAAAGRVIRDKTGLDQIYMEELSIFGDPDRDPRMRIISCAYLSLIDRSRYQLGKSELVMDSSWFEVDLNEHEQILHLCSGDIKLQVPYETYETENGKVAGLEYRAGNNSDLAFDHGTILLTGLLQLRRGIELSDIVFNLLPERFTITQLQQIYEIILGQKLLSPAFRRKISHKIKETGEYTSEKGHRPSQYFEYNKS